MSEKPVASIKTLARYAPDTVYIGTGEYVAECVRADDGDYYLAADADAAIEALQAEIEALRAEVERLQREVGALHMREKRAEAYAVEKASETLKAVMARRDTEERAERLEEGLREAMADANRVAALAKQLEGFDGIAGNIAYSVRMVAEVSKDRIDTLLASGGEGGDRG